MPVTVLETVRVVSDARVVMKESVLTTRLPTEQALWSNRLIRFRHLARATHANRRRTPQQRYRRSLLPASVTNGVIGGYDAVDLAWGYSKHMSTIGLSCSRGRAGITMMQDLALRINRAYVAKPSPHWRSSGLCYRTRARRIAIFVARRKISVSQPYRPTFDFRSPTARLSSSVSTSTSASIRRFAKCAANRTVCLRERSESSARPD